MGIRTRVRRAFIALGTILFIAGISSYLELVRLSNSSKRAIDSGAKSIRMSTEILDIAQQHSDIFLDYCSHLDVEQMSQRSEEIINTLDSIMLDAFANDDMRSSTGFIVEDIERYKQNVRIFYSTAAGSVAIDWYNRFQTDVYFDLVKSMKQYMLSSQAYVVDQTTKIDKGVYRSIMLGIVAISFVIVILLMFYVLLDIYYMRPIVKLTSSLNSYMVSKTPFIVKVDGKDEVYVLKELILDLLSANKSLMKKDKDIFNND